MRPTQEPREGPLPVLSPSELREHQVAHSADSAINDSAFGGTSGLPGWWGWYNWPYWWHHFNSVGRVTWKFKLAAGKSITLGYKWNYYWRP